MVKINKKLRSGEVKIDSYITELEEALLHKETSAIDQFIRASNKVAKVLASDMEKLGDGRIDECQLLKAESSDKTVERIFMVLKNSDVFAEISKSADELLPEIVNEAQDLKVNIEDGENPFEKMQQRVKESGRK